MRVGAYGISDLGIQAAGLVQAVGPEAGGFAPGDRVAFRTTFPATGPSPVVSERELIGFPKDVSVEAAAAYLPLGLLARTVVKQLHSVGRGNCVSVARDDSGVHAFVEAWALDLGATIATANESAKADVVVTEADYDAARRWRYANGLAQIAAADVFQEVRRGVFDAIEVTSHSLTDADLARPDLQRGDFERRSVTSPLVLLPAAA